MDGLNTGMGRLLTMCVTINNTGVHFYNTFKLEEGREVIDQQFKEEKTDGGFRRTNLTTKEFTDYVR